MTTQKISYAASATVTISLASLASSATLVAGRQSASVDNTSNLYDDAVVAGVIKAGSITPPGLIYVYAYAIRDDAPVWPDVMTGSDAAATITSVGVGQGYLKPIAVLNVDTSAVSYWWGPESLAQRFGGIMPQKWGIFVTHNTGAGLDSSAGNHVIKYNGVTYTSA